MANFHTQFPSKYLRAIDLGEQQPIVTIKTITFEDVNRERKMVAYFDGKEKGIVLNKTNANAIANLAGDDDTDFWVGTRLRLVVTQVDYQGKRVPAIRVEAAPRERGAKPLPVAPPPPSEDADEPNDTSVDF